MHIISTHNREVTIITSLTSIVILGIYFSLIFSPVVSVVGASIDESVAMSPVSPLLLLAHTQEGNNNNFTEV